MTTSTDFTISFESPDEEGWIVGVPGAISQGRTREEARDNVLDALRTVLAPDEELSSDIARRWQKMKRKPFSELAKEVRKRPGAATEIDARKNAIVAAVRLSYCESSGGHDIDRPSA
ncbi:MAG: type II toxin-antitoxin system HicB family antitoxin [Solirubrobacterales bacterium]